MDWASCCRDQSAHIKDHCTWVAGRGGGGVPHKGAVPAWLFLGPGNAEHGKGVSQKDSLYEWWVPTKPLDVVFIGPRYNWGPIYGSECL